MTRQQSRTMDEKDIVIDQRLDSYESFFDHSWARSLFKLVQKTRLDPIAFDLCADWKGAANTGRLPWLIVHSLESFHAGFTQNREPFLQGLTRELHEYILDKTKHSFNLTKQKELAGIIGKVSRDLQEEIRRAPSAFSRQKAWTSFLRIEEFTLSLWSSQRMCYGAVYYAYENFLRQCLSIGQKKPADKQDGAERLRKALNTLLGSGIGDTCLGDEKVVLARRVRNALVHNGGRATPEIQARPGTLRIVKGTIHIMPSDVRELYDLLKTCVTALAGEAIATRQFEA